MSPRPDRPAIVAGLAPAFSASQRISEQPCVTRAAMVLCPSSRPSTMPAAMASTFLREPHSSTPITSFVVLTRMDGLAKSCCASLARRRSCTSNPRCSSNVFCYQADSLADAISAATGRPRSCLRKQDDHSVQRLWHCCRTALSIDWPEVLIITIPRNPRELTTVLLHLHLKCSTTLQSLFFRHKYCGPGWNSKHASIWPLCFHMRCMQVAVTVTPLPSCGLQEAAPWMRQQCRWAASP